MLAVRYGKLEKFSKLIDHGANVNSLLTDSNGATILHYACRFKHTAIVKKLLTHGADINSKNDLEITPLMLAIQERQFETAKELLKHDPMKRQFLRQRLDCVSPIQISL